MPPSKRRATQQIQEEEEDVAAGPSTSGAAAAAVASQQERGESNKKAKGRGGGADVKRERGAAGAGAATRDAGGGAVEDEHDDDIYAGVQEQNAAELVRKKNLGLFSKSFFLSRGNLLYLGCTLWGAQIVLRRLHPVRRSHPASSSTAHYLCPRSHKCIRRRWSTGTLRRWPKNFHRKSATSSCPR